jgi:hypothetical protein
MSISRQERLFGPLMHEINSYLVTHVNLHQVQRGIEALTEGRVMTATDVLGAPAFVTLHDILRNYNDVP